VNVLDCDRKTRSESTAFSRSFRSESQKHKAGMMPVETSCFKKGVNFGVSSTSSMAMKINRKKKKI
jgi:hypothetical protein